MNETDDIPDSVQFWMGVRDQKWPHTIDAQVWADEWLATIALNPSIATDRSCMISWFSNSIMAGFDTATYRAAKV